MVSVQTNEWDEKTAVSDGHGAYALGLEDGEAEGLQSGAQYYWRMVAAASARELRPEERDGYTRGFLLGIEIGARARREGAMPHPRTLALAATEHPSISRECLDVRNLGAEGRGK